MISLSEENYLKAIYQEAQLKETAQVRIHFNNRVFESFSILSINSVIKTSNLDNTYISLLGIAKTKKNND